MSTLSNAMYNVEAKCCELILWSLFFFLIVNLILRKEGEIFSCNLKQKDHKVPHHATLKC